MTRQRILRLSQVIKERAAKVILHELKDPRLGFVTVTRVELADDMSFAKVYYSVMGGDGDKSKTRHALDDARGFIQRRVGEGLKTRITPHMTFEFDESVEGQLRMTGLLRKLAAEREENAPAEPDTGADPAV